MGYYQPNAATMCAGPAYATWPQHHPAAWSSFHPAVNSPGASHLRGTNSPNLNNPDIFWRYLYFKPEGRYQRTPNGVFGRL